MMNEQTTFGPSGDSPSRTITIERTYKTTLEKVWDLWTTKSGIESWWGPDGFVVTVQSLDLRLGGELRYTMTATAPEQVQFMEQAGMPLATEVSITYRKVEPLHLLGYRSLADYIPGVQPYEVSTTVALEAETGRVHMALTFDAMHDEQWTERAVMGHESELIKLDEVLEH